MQVDRGNILKTIGMLCNPNFVYSQLIGIRSEPYCICHTPYIFLLPTRIFT